MPNVSSASSGVVYSDKEIEAFCSELDRVVSSSDPAVSSPCMVKEQREYIHSLFNWLPHMINQANELAGREVAKQDFFSLEKIKEAINHLLCYFQKYGIDLNPYNHISQNDYFWHLTKGIIKKSRLIINWTATHVFALQILFVAINPVFIESEFRKVFVAEVIIDPSGKVYYNYLLFFFFTLLDRDGFVLGEPAFPLTASLPLTRSLLESSDSVSSLLGDEGSSVSSSASSTPRSALQLLLEGRSLQSGSSGRSTGSES